MSRLLADGVHGALTHHAGWLLKMIGSTASADDQVGSGFVEYFLRKKVLNENDRKRYEGSKV